LNANRNKSKEIQMKNEIRLALLCLAAASAPAFAQNATPQCGSANFDQTRNAFTIINPAAGAVNQQCLITVYPSGAVPDQARQYPASYLVEGSYVIDLIGGGGGGGGGGGASKDQSGGDGGGGAGAAPSRTVQYLSPGVYKLTIGTGGYGGSANGGRTGDGNPTSLTNVNTGQLIAGFPGADVATQHTEAAGSGVGGVAAAGGASGASGAIGQATTTAGGSGGASVGSGATDESANRNTAAEAGGRGGDGLIRLTMSEPAPKAIGAVPVAAPAMSSSSESVTTPARAAARPARKDRN
jgi:hypothetical protein